MKWNIHSVWGRFLYQILWYSSNSFLPFRQSRTPFDWYLIIFFLVPLTLDVLNSNTDSYKKLVTYFVFEFRVENTEHFELYRSFSLRVSQFDDLSLSCYGAKLRSSRSLSLSQRESPFLRHQSRRQTLISRASLPVKLIVGIVEWRLTFWRALLSLFKALSFCQFVEY